MKQHTIEINIERCVGCALCKRDCPVNNIDIVDKKAVIKYQECIRCGHCVAVCPKAAVSITGFDHEPLEYQQQVTLDAEQLMQAIKSRRTIRHFTNQEIPSEVIEQIIEAGRFTPTGENKQNLSYIVLKKEINIFEQKAGAFMRKLLALARPFVKKLRNVTIDEQFIFKKAPCAILVVYNGRLGKENGLLAAANMALMAEAHGLGVLYSGFFTIIANYLWGMKKSLGLKSNEKVAMTLVLGYPNVKYYRTAQRETAVVVYK